MSTPSAGPEFMIESSRAVIILGHSERLAVGQLWAEELDRRKLFEDIELTTLNKAAAMVGRTSLRQHLKRSTVFTHSAALTRVHEALQIVALNPPEPVRGIWELVRRASDIVNDPIVPEPGAHKTGKLDLLQAGMEIARSSVSSAVTMYKIGRGGNSSVRELSDRAADFPAGRAIVHSEFDKFGFSDAADMTAAANAGITTLTIPGTYHNSILFVSDKMLSEMTPAILPPSSTS